MDKSIEHAEDKAAAGRRGSRVAAVVALFLLIYIPSTFNWFSGGAVSTDVLRDGSLYEALNAEALVIRDEALLIAETDGYSIPAAGEGERVAGKSVVAYVYDRFSYGLAEEYERVCYELLRERYLALKDGAHYSQEADGAEREIALAVKNMIPGLNHNALPDASARVRSIDALLLKRAEAYAAFETDDAGVARLERKKREIESGFGEGRAEARAPFPGYASFYTDGWEPVLTPDAISGLTPELFGEVAGAGRGGEDAPGPNAAAGMPVKEGAPFAKIVKGNTYYFAISAPAGFINRFSQGERVRLRTERPHMEIENAEIAALIGGACEDGGIAREDGGIAGESGGIAGEDSGIAGEDGGIAGEGVGGAESGFIVIKLNKYLYEFLNARVVGVALAGKYREGLKIPLKCLRDVDIPGETAYITLAKGSHASVRKVKILASNEVYAIIESYDDSAAENRVSRYDTYIRDAVNIEDGMVVKPSR